jgi:RNA polymerase sigma factor (sigma-70 family)
MGDWPAPISPSERDASLAGRPGAGLPRLDEATAAALFVRARAGDSLALGELVRTMTPVLWQVARHSGLDHGGCEDVIQTTWLRLFGAPEALRTPDALAGWLITVTRREAWRVVAAGRREQPAEEALIDHAGPPSASPEHDSVSEKIVADERDRVLWEAVNQLSPRCRELLRLVAFVHRPSYDTVARALDLPVGSIGPTRGRCLAKLRAALSADPRWSS